MVTGKGAAKAPLLLAFPPGKHFLGGSSIFRCALASLRAMMDIN